MTVFDGGTGNGFSVWVSDVTLQDLRRDNGMAAEAGHPAKLKLAVREQRAAQRVLDGFNAIEPTKRLEWQAKVDVWYNDRASPPTVENPFALPKASKSNLTP